MDVAKYQIEYTYFKKYFLFCKSITTNIIYPGKISSIIPSLFFSFIMHKSSNYFFVFTSYCDNSTFLTFLFFFIPSIFPIFKITIILINFLLGRKFHISSNVSIKILQIQNHACNATLFNTIK